MRTNLIIDGVVILIVALLLDILRRFVGGIFNILLWVAIVILVVVGIIRIVEGILAKPRKRVRVVHHVHHYEKPKK